MLRGDGYTHVVDFWAIGAMLYEMIFGFPPFFGESPEEVFMNIMNYDQCLAFPEEGQGPHISSEAQSLIRALLTEPQQRLGTIAEIKRHAFYKDFPWDTILREEPPFVPDLEGTEDHSYFNVPDKVPSVPLIQISDETPPPALSPRDDWEDSPRDFDEAGLEEEDL